MFGLFTYCAGTILEKELNYLNEIVPITEKLESCGVGRNSCLRGRREFLKMLFKDNDSYKVSISYL